MNLIEAIKSGRPFRPTGGIWAWVTVHGGLLKYALASGDLVEQPLTVAEIVGDWEVQEPAATITRTQFREALAEANKFYTPYALKILAEKLGLEEWT